MASGRPAEDVSPQLAREPGMGTHLRVRELMVTEALRCPEFTGACDAAAGFGGGRDRRACSLPCRLGVSSWTGEAEDPVLRHARGPRRLLRGGRWPGAVV